MKKWIATTLVAWGLVAGVPATGFAEQQEVSKFTRRQISERDQGRGKRAHEQRWKRWSHDKGELAPEVPELDPGAAGTAFALLAAATALLLERKRALRG